MSLPQGAYTKYTIKELQLQVDRLKYFHYLLAFPRDQVSSAIMSAGCRLPRPLDAAAFEELLNQFWVELNEHKIVFKTHFWSKSQDGSLCDEIRFNISLTFGRDATPEQFEIVRVFEKEFLARLSEYRLSFLPRQKTSTSEALFGDR